MRSTKRDAAEMTLRVLGLSGGQICARGSRARGRDGLPQGRNLPLDARISTAPSGRSPPFGCPDQLCPESHDKDASGAESRVAPLRPKCLHLSFVATGITACHRIHRDCAHSCNAESRAQKSAPTLACGAHLRKGRPKHATRARAPHATKILGLPECAWRPCPYAIPVRRQEEPRRKKERKPSGRADLPNMKRKPQSLRGPRHAPRARADPERAWRGRCVCAWPAR